MEVNLLVWVVARVRCQPAACAAERSWSNRLLTGPEVQIFLAAGEFRCHPSIVVAEAVERGVRLTEERPPPVVVVSGHDVDGVGFGELSVALDDEKVFRRSWCWRTWKSCDFR